MSCGIWGWVSSARSGVWADLQRPRPEHQKAVPSAHWAPGGACSSHWEDDVVVGPSLPAHGVASSALDKAVPGCISPYASSEPEDLGLGHSQPLLLLSQV